MKTVEKAKETFLMIVSALRMVRYFLPHLRPVRWRLGFNIGMGIVDSVISAFIPLIAKFILDDVLIKKNWSLFWKVITVYLSAFLVMEVLNVVRSYLSLYISSIVDWRFRILYFYHLNLLPFSRIKQKQAGEHLFGINSDLSRVSSMILSFIPSFLNNIVALVTAIIIMIRIKWQIAVVYLIAIPVLFVLRIIASAILKPRQAELREINERTNGSLVEKMRLLPLIKLFSRERHETHQYSLLMKERIKQSFRLWRLRTVLERIRWFLESGSATVLTCFIWIMVMRGTMTIGSGMALTMYLGMVLPPFMAFAGIFQNLISGLVPGERVLEFFQQPEETGRKFSGYDNCGQLLSVTFEGVGFSYDGNKKVIKDAGFKIPGGSITAFVGPSGSGKTTILNLICFLYPSDNGRIMLGDCALQDFNPRHIRRLISVAPQESLLFSGTVKDNILYGDPSASDGRVLRAAEQACAREFIELLPEGFDTDLKGEHVRLSAGQKHRLTLARAFIRRSGILILDEPFASVDIDAETRLWRSLLTFKGEKTIIVVTHRPPPVDIANLVFRVEEGVVTEIRSKVSDELLRI